MQLWNTSHYKTELSSLKLITSFSQSIFMCAPMCGWGERGCGRTNGRMRMHSPVESSIFLGLSFFLSLSLSLTVCLSLSHSLSLSISHSPSLLSSPRIPFILLFHHHIFLTGPSSYLLQTESDDTPAPVAIDEDSLLPPASMDELDDYLDMLYQVRG